MPAMRNTALSCLSGVRRRAFVRAVHLRPASQILSKQPGQARWISQKPKCATATPQVGKTGLDELEIVEQEEPSSAHLADLTLPPASALSDFREGATVTVHGFLTKRRDMSKQMTFCDLDTCGDHKVQIFATSREDSDATAKEAFNVLKEISPFTPVAVTGTLQSKHRHGQDPKHEEDSSTDLWALKWDLKLTQIKPLNTFPTDIVVSKDAVWPLSQRHLQLRFDSLLRHRLQVRSMANFTARRYLTDSRFFEYETPILFKSTPEGAREFIVPSRQPGLAYALPQSPQQYKQVLMASGLRRYYQFARCFRDEDSRADRQPEFTQLDLEMAFATGEDVIRTVENIVWSIFTHLRDTKVAREVEGMLYVDPAQIIEDYGPSASPEIEGVRSLWPLKDPRTQGFVRVKYDDAMARYGSDKPDLRISSEIQRIEDILPAAFKSMITNLEDPIVEAAQFKLNGSPSQNLMFIRKFMDNLKNTTLKLGSASTPGVFIFDETKPLNGLAAFGHETGEFMTTLHNEGWSQLQHGDLLIVHARQRAHFQGEGWTELGRLRKAIYDAAVQEGLIKRDISFRFCWVTDFPLFTPDIDPGEGQGGTAGLKATHHPFTAPLRSFTTEDLDSLAAGRPWEIKADHYDLVLNGTEVGGGSRRIHQRAVQEFVMRNILKMTHSGMQQFGHLFRALEAGCPPHAGFALGWDRFITLLCGVDSVRDVIAFPKNQKGEDLFAKSPSQLTDAQLRTYYLEARGWHAQDYKAW